MKIIELLEKRSFGGRQKPNLIADRMWKRSKRIKVANLTSWLELMI